MKQIVTINLNHICPMVTGVTPHIGGPIIGPGCPGVMVNGVPISVMGDMYVVVRPTLLYKENRESWLMVNLSYYKAV